MKCLSVRQPWAWAIIHGPKRVENRTRRTSHRGPLLIHASKSREFLDGTAPADWRELPGLPEYDQLPFGAVIGVVDLVGCHLLADLPPSLAGPFVTGPVCWVLANPRPLAKPVPFTGMVGLFDVPDDLVAGLIR
jgi:hypothetical protein